MKIYIPFLLVSISVVIVIFIFYNPVSDYLLNDNVYGYKQNSFKILKSNKLEVDKYYIYLDCYAGNDGFEVKNIELYKGIDDCSVDINKINHLNKYYSVEEIKNIALVSFDYKKIDKDNSKTTYNYLIDEKYDPLKFERYLIYEGEKTIMNVNLNHDLKEYSDFTSVSLSEDVVVNKYNKLSDYNSSLNYCRGYYVFSENMCNNLYGFLNEINISYRIVEVYNKKDLFNEHATGLALNIEYNYEFDNYVEEVASRYGFIMRYKKEYFNVTGVEESGHFRYVGQESVEIYKQQVSLEEYQFYSS